jgi:hypothetical protein
MILYGINPIILTPQREVVDVVVVIGQSNARGQNQDAGWLTFPEAYKVLIPKAFINYAYDTPPNNTSNQPLDGSIDSVSKRFRYVSVQYGLAKAYTEYKNRPLYIVHYAIGTTSLQIDWNPDGPGSLYNNMIAYVTNEINTLLNQNKIPRIVAYYWNQGEQDANLGVAPGQYLSMLNNFFSRLRNTPALIPYCIGGTNVNIQIALLGTWTTTQNQSYNANRLLIRADQASFANNNTNVQLIETEDLPSIVGDEIHRTTGAQFTIASRLFENIKDIAN